MAVFGVLCVGWLVGFGFVVWFGFFVGFFFFFNSMQDLYSSAYNLCKSTEI